MSWSGFKKNVGRATTQVMMKTGHVDKTSDRDYEVEERRYRTLESASLRLQKEAKGYLDSLRAMTASQMRIAETIDAFYGDSGAKDGVSRSYKQAVEDLDAETVKALDGPYRCVARDPRILDVVEINEGDGVYNDAVLDEVQAELNFRAGNRRVYTRDAAEEAQMAYELIEDCFRTTVLEPINRFCAYFPDINECIKKRNHKMLDYDAMRSKVKKLVEKPDKDPSKLPRTEKETEMVMDTPSFLLCKDFLFLSSPPKVLAGLGYSRISSPQKLKALAKKPEETSQRFQTFNDNLQWNSMPQRDPDVDAVLRSVGAGVSSNRKPSALKRLRHASFKFTNALLNMDNQEPASPRPCQTSSRHFQMKPLKTNAKETLNGSGNRLSQWSSESSSRASCEPCALSTSQDCSPFSAPRSSVSPFAHGVNERPPPSSRRSVWNSSSPTHGKMVRSKNYAARVTSMPMHPRDEYLCTSPSRRFSGLSVTRKQSSEIASIMLGNTRSTVKDEDDISGIERTYSIDYLDSPSTRSSIARTAFFHPSELEDALAPMKAEFIEKQTDLLVQAKAAYDQLNEQLLNELPQLIDLRVPYLDPSFEALVKIQLRFCAEAYSRMAQVQQYLDASTRDQYANGDLDARVEDVLGQIRELSIAGTV